MSPISRWFRHAPPFRRVVSARDVDAAAGAASLIVPRGTIITPAARDRAHDLNLAIDFVEPPTADDPIDWLLDRSGDPVESFAEFATLFPGLAVPDRVIEATRLLVLDAFSVAFAGMIVPGFRDLVPALRRLVGPGRCRIVGQGVRMPAAEAAMVNAAFVHGLAFDPIDDASGCAPLGPIVATALAASEEAGGVTGRDFLASIAIGCELALRVGRMAPAFRVDRSAAAGLIGAAAVGARLFRLSPATGREALALAVAHGLPPVLDSGTTADGLAAGVAARSALTAVRLASAGLSGPQRVFDGPDGLCSTIGANARRDGLTVGLGQVWLTLEVASRPYPGSRWSHPLVAGLLALRERGRLRPDRLRWIEIDCAADAAGSNLTAESGPAEQRVSLAYVAAYVSLYGDLDLAAFGPSPDPDALELSRKVRLVVDPAASGAVPLRIRVRTTSNRTYSETVESVPGAPGHPMTREARIAKLRQCWNAAGLRFWRRPERLVSAIDDLAAAPSPSALWSAIVAE